MSRLPILCAPSALRAFLPPLLTQGACLVFTDPAMPVPIPLNECVLSGDACLLWATCHTPYGPVRPCVGRLIFTGWQSLDGPHGGCSLHDTKGSELARIVPSRALPLTDARATRLCSEQAQHRLRAARDAAYAHRWARSFHEASHSVSPPVFSRPAIPLS